MASDPSPLPTPQIDDMAIVAAVLAVRPDAQAIYRFGSTATGYARPDSDIDIAVLVDRPITGEERMRLMTGVACVAHRDGDIMDLAQASPIAQAQVIGSGRTLADADPNATGKFELRALKDYQDLRFRRRALEADLLKHGWPHA